MKIKHLTIIGIGLIGGSFSRALQRADVVERVTGCARSISELEKAIKLGVIDDFSTDPAEAVKGADLVLISIPLGACDQIFAKIKPSLGSDTIVTDAGSVKGSVVDSAREHLGDKFPQFVPGHPIAGTEKSGVDASFAELYDNHRVILTPAKETSPEALDKVRRLWELAGAGVDFMDVDRHDEVLAATSHLPHVMAYSLVNTLSKMEESGDVFRFAAGGFADFTRIASSSPQMWHDIVFTNREAVLQLLERYENSIDELKEALRNNDNEFVMKMMTDAKKARDEFADNRQRRQVKADTEQGEE
ncbi:MAG: prephenate dehydrogenase [Gammaproteobacteria bacterium]